MMKKMNLILWVLACVFAVSCTKDGSYTPPAQLGDEIILEEWHSFNTLEMEAGGTIGGGTLVLVESDISKKIEKKGNWYVYIQRNNKVTFIPEWTGDIETEHTELGMESGEFVVQRLAINTKGYEFGVRAHLPEELNTSSLKVRAVFIPNGEQLDADVDFTNYNEVKAYFKL